MRPNDLLPLLDFIRSLSFGGLFGGGITGLLHALFQATVLASVPYAEFVVAGALLGTVFHRSIAVSWDHVLGPAVGFGRTHLEVWKLRQYLQRGWISEEQYRQMTLAIVEEDILRLPRAAGDDRARLLSGGDGA